LVQLGSNEDVLICYGNTLFEPGFGRAWLRSHEPIASLCFLDRSDREQGQFREYALVREGSLSSITTEPIETEGLRTAQL